MFMHVYVWDAHWAAVEGSCCESLACSITVKVFHYHWFAHTVGWMETERGRNEWNDTTKEIFKQKKTCVILIVLTGSPLHLCLHTVSRVGDHLDKVILVWFNMSKMHFHVWLCYVTLCLLSIISLLKEKILSQKTKSLYLD